MRENDGPQFILARCVHLEGHMLGDLLVRTYRNPNMLAEVSESLQENSENIDEILLILRNIGGQFKKRMDPIVVIKKKLKNDADRLKQIEEEVTKEIKQITKNALEIYEGGIKNG
jgi:TPP-dependent pyruvate/acetoin dehydrogenase alpha subunit